MKSAQCSNKVEAVTTAVNGNESMDLCSEVSLLCHVFGRGGGLHMTQVSRWHESRRHIRDTTSVSDTTHLGLTPKACVQTTCPVKSSFQ